METFEDAKKFINNNKLGEYMKKIVEEFPEYTPDQVVIQQVLNVYKNKKEEPDRTLID